MSLSEPPATPLRLTTALQNRLLVGGACKTLPPYGAKGALLRYDLCFAVAANGCVMHYASLRVVTQGLVLSYYLLVTTLQLAIP